MVAKSARFLAPIALAAVAVGIYLILHAGLATKPHSVVHSATVRTTQSQRRASTKPKFYVVKSGDTLSAISVRTNVSISRIRILNPAVAPNSLQTGQRLRLRR